MMMCVQGGLHLAVQGIHLGDPVDLIPEKFHPDQVFPALGGIDLDHVSPHPEAAPVQIHVVAVVLDRHQGPQHVISVFVHPGP